MEAALRSILVCPLCHHDLVWSAEELVAGDVRSASAHCPSCGVRSAVHEGVGFFLPGDAPDHFPGPPSPEPFEEPLLMGGEEAALAKRSLSPFATAIGRVLELEPRSPVVSLGEPKSGGPRPLVGSSYPDRIRSFRSELGFPESWDALCFEIHSMPFKDRSLNGALLDATFQTTPGPLVILRELRRIVRGPLVVPLALVDGLPETDRDWLSARGWAELFEEKSLLDLFRKARWQATFEPFGTRSHPRDPTRGFPSESVETRVGLLVAQ